MMRTEKRWLKQVIKEVADKHIEMPWKKIPQSIAQMNLPTDNDLVKAA